ncbi:MAG: hypothetical protein COV29_01550 [Candidatus Yanofskybacteria bacterium CG10_big_fil_rev_8_21_14_0_10_36_16]|uniref:Uncharacterized protein n=1 Tax=Candidatus Yanofskybacteria bacterium CG10_big_fil_rev_8_21_14_0_10_36_16 TaxID=1975096 RepID=A0A2J0Q7E2_9BACT|nr:MAG: hypothetical protein COV29_01550 [Candidatus Yanofskybacteria bacterium CG10_big_fil_rev_8_21_14_0_10_36_16]
MVFLFKKKYDLHFFFGILLIFIGILAFATPFTPGSWLAVVGFVWVFGKKRSRRLLKQLLGKKISHFIQLDKIIEKIDKALDK